MTQPTSHHLAQGGETIETNTGPIFVRQVRPVEILDYLRAEAESEEAVLALVCDPPPDLSALDMESYEALIEADQRQNFTHARRREARETERAQRTLAALKANNPDLYARIEAEQVKLLESTLSSLAPAHGASAPGAPSPAKPPSPS